MNKSYLIKQRKNLKGSITVEMSYVLPIIIFLIFLLIHTVFYYHDKAVLAGAVAESVEQGIEDVRSDKDEESDLNAYLRGRIGNKLIWLRTTSLSAEKQEDVVRVRVDAGRWIFRTSVYLEGRVPYPEKELREKKKAEELIN